MVTKTQGGGGVVAFLLIVTGIVSLSSPTPHIEATVGVPGMFEFTTGPVTPFVNKYAKGTMYLVPVTNGSYSTEWGVDVEFLNITKWDGSLRLPTRILTEEKTLSDGRVLRPGTHQFNNWPMGRTWPGNKFYYRPLSPGGHKWELVFGNEDAGYISIELTNNASVIRVVNQSTACTTGTSYHTTIGDALGNSSSGNTIEICQGTYDENLIVTIPVNIYGFPRDASKVFVNSSTKTDPVFNLQNSSINISFLTIGGTTIDLDAGIESTGNYDGHNLSYNIFHDMPASDSILLQSGVDNVLVSNNVIENDVFGRQAAGVRTFNANTITIRGNTLRVFPTNAKPFISFGTACDNCVIVNNTVSGGSGDPTRYTLDLRGDNITVENNTFTVTNYSDLINTVAASNLTIVNNLFNVSNMGYMATAGQVATYNKTKRFDVNIIGDPLSGGNYWGYWNRSGFSDTCNDTDRDGICDTAYAPSSSSDYLPLTNAPPNVSLNPNSARTGYVSGSSPYIFVNCTATDESGIDTRWIEFDGVNYTGLSGANTTFNENTTSSVVDSEFSCTDYYNFAQNITLPVNSSDVVISVLVHDDYQQYMVRLYNDSGGLPGALVTTSSPLPGDNWVWHNVSTSSKTTAVVWVVVDAVIIDGDCSSFPFAQRNVSVTINDAYPGHMLLNDTNGNGSYAPVANRSYDMTFKLWANHTQDFDDHVDFPGKDYSRNFTGLSNGDDIPYACWANDTLGAFNRSIIQNISIDNVPPRIFTNITNTTYPGNMSAVLNVSDRWWNNSFFWIDGTKTITTPAATNRTVSLGNLSRGQHNFTIYANDSAGNTNTSEVIFSVIHLDTRLWVYNGTGYFENDIFYDLECGYATTACPPDNQNTTTPILKIQNNGSDPGTGVRCRINETLTGITPKMGNSSTYANAFSLTTSWVNVWSSVVNVTSNVTLWMWEDWTTPASFDAGEYHCEVTVV
jgi:hypothetical protein